MARFRNDQGFGLVELLIAMTVMNVGVLAVVAAFTSGALAINRASATTTAAALADAQMEAYRAMEPSDIGLDTSSGTLAALDTTYKSDVACWDANAGKDCTQIPDATLTADNMALTGPTSSVSGGTPDSCSTIETWFSRTLPCHPSRDVTATTSPASPDGRGYRIDTYIMLLQGVAANPNASPPVLGQRARKQVTVVVRDLNNLGHVYVRETSVFDCTSGAIDGSTC